MRESPGDIAFSAAPVLLLLLAAGAVLSIAGFLAMPVLLDRLYRYPGAGAAPPAVGLVMQSAGAVFRLRAFPAFE